VLRFTAVGAQEGLRPVDLAGNPNTARRPDQRRGDPRAVRGPREEYRWPRRGEPTALPPAILCGER
jgi:hypothetical protein